MFTMPRFLLTLTTVAVLAAACGDAGTEPAPAATTDQPVVTAADDEPATAQPAPAESDAPAQITSTVDGPEAPNFALTLGTGTDQFVLGEVNKPVYLIYWADW